MKNKNKSIDFSIFCRLCNSFIAKLFCIIFYNFLHIFVTNWSKVQILNIFLLSLYCIFWQYHLIFIFYVDYTAIENFLFNWTFTIIFIYDFTIIWTVFLIYLLEIIALFVVITIDLIFFTFINFILM